MGLTWGSEFPELNAELVIPHHRLSQKNTAALGCKVKHLGFGLNASILIGKGMMTTMLVSSSRWTTTRKMNKRMDASVVCD